MQSLGAGEFIIYFGSCVRGEKKKLLADLYTYIIKEAKDDYLDVKWLLQMMQLQEENNFYKVINLLLEILDRWELWTQ